MKPFALTKHDSETSSIRPLSEREIASISGGDGERMTTWCQVGVIVHTDIGPQPWYGLDDYDVGPPGTNPGIGG